MVESYLRKVKIVTIDEAYIGKVVDWTNPVGVVKRGSVVGKVNTQKVRVFFYIDLHPSIVNVVELREVILES